MKKFLLVVVLFYLVFGIPSRLLAGGRNYLVNQSAEFLKTMNRGQTQDADADKTYFNPAGTALFPDGLYLYASNQFIIQNFDIKPQGGHWNEILMVSKDEYKYKKNGYVFPNVYVVYKKEKFAWSVGILPIGGGGNADFPDGLQSLDVTLKLLAPMLNNFYASLGLPQIFGNPGFIYSRLKGTNVVIAEQANIAYSIIPDKLAISAGYRIMEGIFSISGKIYAPGSGATFGGYIPLGSNPKVEQNGIAHGVIISINIKPINNLTISMKGEWMSQLRYRTESRDWLILGLNDSGMIDGHTKPGQLPANLEFGVGYKITKDFQILAGGIYAFNQFSNWNKLEKKYTGGIDLAAGFDYTIRALPIPINVGAGYAWNTYGARPSARSQQMEELDLHNISFGLSLFFLDDTLKLTVAQLFQMAPAVDINKGTLVKFFPARIHKYVYITGLGLSYKIF